MLETVLNEMEGGQSPFECQLRQMPLPKAAILSRSEGQFEVASDFSEGFSVREGVGDLFPGLIARGATQVLRLSDASSSGESVGSHRIAVLFSGGPAAGGHNVVLGLKSVLGESDVLFGVKAGPKGLMAGDLFEIDDESVSRVRNLGGFDFLGSDRSKIKTQAQFDQVKETVRRFSLTGIVVIGGDDSNTNAAILAEALLETGCSVIGVPKTIDGDLQYGSALPISFGFDTATKIYAELVGNILQDTPSSRKYWHFVKVMGRSASHVALEVALQCRPAVTFISEEVEEKQYRIDDIVSQIARAVAYRSAKGMDYGVVLIPEGLIEFVPEFTRLIQALNDVLAGDLPSGLSREAGVLAALDAQNADLFKSLPDFIRGQLIMDRDSHGNLKVSQIQTEQLLMALVEEKVAAYKTDLSVVSNLGLSDDELATFVASSFSSNAHFFGYEGRCGAPSMFDAVYTDHLGGIAGYLIRAGYTGYMAAFCDLASGGMALGLPLLSMIHMERRHGEEVPVIEKALVKLDSPAFRYFAARREIWMQSDCFTSPGPRQYASDLPIVLPFTVALNQGLSSFHCLLES